MKKDKAHSFKIIEPLLKLKVNKARAWKRKKRMAEAEILH